MIALNVNGKSFDLNVEPETPLLWVLRDTIGLTGTKFGCGAGLCGACTVHIDGTPARSCLLSVGGLAGREVVTIESIVENKANPVVMAWIEEQVPQCGYCQNGMIIQASDLLATTKNPSAALIKTAMNGHLCRCGTYSAVIRAVQRAAAVMAKGA